MWIRHSLRMAFESDATGALLALALQEPEPHHLANLLLRQVVPQIREDRPDHLGELLGLPLGEPHLAHFDAHADRFLPEEARAGSKDQPNTP